MTIVLEDVKRLQLSEGDTLVLRVREDMPVEMIEALGREMEKNFPGHKTLVLMGNALDLEVVEAVR